MVNALVVRKHQLPKHQKSFRAAQYVRMSTDYQAYSIENQAAAIAAYAQMHDLSIVRTYRDEGESGLRLKNRTGLVQLLHDVDSGEANFDYILVYDVSRWGRFQDVDESAHYEFICRKAGIKVVYCAEQFDNDGCMLSSIVKNIKRVMAAEFSRELSAKVHTGQCRIARLGFKMGGPVGYAFQRELVGPDRQPKGTLKTGDRKNLRTDRVRVRPGTSDEVAIVRWIFQEFEQTRSETAIVRDLNQKGVPTGNGRPWNRPLVSRILRNEGYVGNLVYNRRSRKLGATNLVENPPQLWIRAEGCIEPIIERSAFLRVQKIIEERRVSLPEEEMLARLRRTLMKEGRLNSAIIDRTIGLPCKATYAEHFGNLRNVYRLIGYTPKRNFEYLNAKPAWEALMTKLGAELATAISNASGRNVPVAADNCVRVSQNVSICLRIARWYPGKRSNHSPLWVVQRHVNLPVGWVVAIRLGEHNQEVLDYLLFPSSQVVGLTLKLSEAARARRGVYRFKTFDALVRSLIRRLPATSRAYPAKPVRPSKGSRSSRSRTKSGRAQR